MTQPLCESLVAKIREQIELLDRLIERLPDDRLDWRPALDNSWAVSQLLGHLLECLAGICAVLRAADPERLAHFDELRALPVNHSCGREEARRRIRDYERRIEEGFSLMTDEDLARRIPTVFVPAGETLLTLALGNLEHLINHKHELFTCLKSIGAGVGTRDLYRFRDE